MRERVINLIGQSPSAVCKHFVNDSGRKVAVLIGSNKVRRLRNRFYVRDRPDSTDEMS